jgi:hypothetical protein
MLARLLSLALLTLAIAPIALADAAALRRTWLERVAISAADKVCALFSEGERLALRSGLYQVEGELLRAKQSRAEMTRLAAEVSERAASLGCGHPDVVSVAATVRNSFRQFAKTSYIEYPAARSTWGASRSEYDKWATSQTDKASGLIFGLRRTPGKPDEFRLAVSMPARGATPAAAQLVFRDVEKMPDPWFGSLSGKDGKLAAPPRATSHLIWAAKVMAGKNEVSEPIWIFVFAASAIEQLDLLDPREAVQVNLLPAPRAKDQAKRQVTFELGDFRAARAFAMIPKIDFPPSPVAERTAPAAH